MQKKDDKNRLFFHDVINHIHGMLLFLNYRAEDKKGASVNDCEKLIGELKLLQSLVQDHFGLSHKNLPPNHPYADVSFVQKGVKSMISIYLPGRFCKIDFKGSYKGEIHYIIFCRIIGNIIKNIAEAKGDKAEFLFSFQKDGLHLTTQNKINGKKKHEGLKEGAGLLSVKNLCQKEGGEFHFFKEGDTWINKVFLPWYPNSEK